MDDLIDQRHGHIDILVNDIGGEAYSDWGKTFWTTDFDQEYRLFEVGLLTHIRSAHAFLPLLTRSPGGLRVEITDGTRAHNDGHYREGVYLDLTKTAVSRLAFGLGHELSDVQGTALAITPG